MPVLNIIITNRFIVNKINYPKISIVMPVFNDEKGILQALDSVKKQKYPENRIEVIVIDNGSLDNTVSNARRYTRHISINKQSAYRNRADGMRKATGEFVYMILEQDMELKSKYFLQKMVKPLIEDGNLAASFTREYPRADQPWITRFISYHPLQLDPLFEYLTPSLESTFINKMKDYVVCRFVLGKMPPATHMLYRVAYLKQTEVWKQKEDFDHDTVIRLVKSGYNLFAYVPSAGIYHHHAKNLKQLISKRRRNLNNHYFQEYNNTGYKWYNPRSKRDIARLIIWVIYANLLFPALIRGIYRFIKIKDWVFLMEPVITIATTDVILWTFLTSHVGRRLLVQSVKTLIHF